MTTRESRSAVTPISAKRTNSVGVPNGGKMRRTTSVTRASSSVRSASKPRASPSPKKVAKRSVSAPMASRINFSNSAGNGTTPKKRAPVSSAFGRSNSSSRSPTCVELWGPLGAKQRLAAEGTPLHMRPSNAKILRPLSQRSASLPRDTFRSQEPRTPPSQYSRVSHSNMSAGFTGPLRRKSIPQVHDFMNQILLGLIESESRERSLIEWGAANTLKTGVHGFRLGTKAAVSCFHGAS